MDEFPPDVQGSGDVISHLSRYCLIINNRIVLDCHHDYKGPNGEVHLSTIPNPSHLEVACSVGSGKARARARTLNVGDYAGGRVGDAILLLHYHGDGAFTGQVIFFNMFII